MINFSDLIHHFGLNPDFILSQELTSKKGEICSNQFGFNDSFAT